MALLPRGGYLVSSLQLYTVSYHTFDIAPIYSFILGPRPNKDDGTERGKQNQRRIRISNIHQQENQDADEPGKIHVVSSSIIGVAIVYDVMVVVSAGYSE